MSINSLSAIAVCIAVTALGQLCMSATAQAGECLRTPGTSVKPRELRSLIVKRKSYNPHIVAPLKLAYKFCIAGEEALLDARKRYPAHYQNALKAQMESNPRYRPRVLAPEPNWSTIGYSTEEDYYDGQRHARATHDTKYDISMDGDCALIKTPVEQATIETEKEIIDINMTRGTVERKTRIVSKEEIKRNMTGVPTQSAMVLARGFEAGQEFWDKYWPLTGESKSYAGECCQFTIPENEASGKSRMCVLQVAPFFHGYRDHPISLRDEPLGVDGGAWTEATDVDLDTRVNPAVFTSGYYTNASRPPPVSGGNPGSNP
jgi:hypothetical protein